MKRCWPFADLWGKRRRRDRGWCGGCAAFGEFLSRRLARGRENRVVGDSVLHTDEIRRNIRRALANDSDGVGLATGSVYIDYDILMRSASLPTKPRETPCSVVRGARGLPNSSQPFFQARGEATDRRVWLVVNLQHPDAKLSEKLNADVWSNPIFCSDVLVNKAMLWQRDVGHIQAQQFIVYYFDGCRPRAEECPIVMLLDPRTGRALRRWRAGSEQFSLEPEKAFQQITHFFDMHTLEGVCPPESPQRSPKNSPMLQPSDSLDSPGGVCLEIVEELLTESTLGAIPSAPSCTKTATETSEGSTSAATSPRMSAMPSDEGPVHLLFRFPDGARCECAMSSDVPIAHVLEMAGESLQKRLGGEPCHKQLANDVLLEVSEPLQQTLALHALPLDTPLGLVDVHRKVLNVRLKSPVS